MPDPVLFAKAMTAAGVTCVVVFAACVGWMRPASAVRNTAASVLGMIGALLVGGWILGLRPHWPPSDALDRLLFVVLPATMAIELLAAVPKMPRSAVWILRVCLAAGAGRILLHGSGYLKGSVTGWTVEDIRVALVVSAVSLIVVWWLLVRLVERSPGVSVLLVLAQVIVTSGLALMLSGYATGGQAALPPAAGLVAIAVAAWGLKTAPSGVGALGIGITSLFGILILGRFFGELSTGRALVLLFAPLVCWATELPALRAQKPWVIGSVRLALASIPLAAVLFLAQRDFAKNMESTTGGEYQSDEY
jgi:hypothetical protein